jgi:hypothetical protein
MLGRTTGAPGRIVRLPESQAAKLTTACRQSALTAPQGVYMLLVLALAAMAAGAECLVPLPPCEALKAASLVVLADAIEVGPATVTTGAVSTLIPQEVTFRTIENFKGGKPENQLFKERMQSGTPESTRIARRRRYLVYAVAGRDGVLQTACSRTREVDTSDVERQREMQEELRQLRACRSPDAGQPNQPLQPSSGEGAPR